MIDTANLRTASLYVNNQLLSRGLLRDGQTIDFAHLGQGKDGASSTAGRIISLVNDLILRRDRDADKRESLSMAMRELRTENLQQMDEIARLTAKNDEERRKADGATASEAGMRRQLKTAEATTRGLKDELARVKALVAQARAACAIDVRRRDRQIDTLKKQLSDAGRARGTRTNASWTTITVTGDFGLEKEARKSVSGHGDVLRGETNTSITQLARRLGEENELMLDLVQRAVKELRSMSGCEAETTEAAASCVRPSCEAVVAELDCVMEHMRELLTSPRFVPIEEAIVRQEEIERLEATVSYMESRWEMWVQLMQSWRKALATGGPAIRDEDLEKGLRLSPVRLDGAGEMRRQPLAAVAEEDADDLSQHSPCAPKRLGRLTGSKPNDQVGLASSLELQVEVASKRQVDDTGSSGERRKLPWQVKPCHSTQAEADKSQDRCLDEKKNENQDRSLDKKKDEIQDRCQGKNQDKNQDTSLDKKKDETKERSQGKIQDRSLDKKKDDNQGKTQDKGQDGKKDEDERKNQETHEGKSNYYGEDDTDELQRSPQRSPHRSLPRQTSSPTPKASQPGPLGFSPSAGNRGTPRPRRGPTEQTKMRRVSVVTKSLRSLPVRARTSATTQPRAVGTIRAKQQPSTPQARRSRDESAKTPSGTKAKAEQPAPAAEADRVQATKIASWRGAKVELASAAEPDKEQAPKAAPAAGTRDKADEPPPAAQPNRAQASAGATTQAPPAAEVDAAPEHDWQDEEPQPADAPAEASATRPRVAKTAVLTAYPSPSAKIIAAKLAASEREANAMRVRAKLRAARACSGGVARPPPVAPPPEPAPTSGDIDVDPVKQPQRKRERRTGRAAARRRSTLTPCELQALISGCAQ